jgi:tetratricopeptide (TPR) repeat protein
MLGWYQVEKLKKFVFPFLLIFLSFFANLALSQQYLDYQDKELKGLLLEGIDDSFREDYSFAEKNFKQLLSKAPQDPGGYFFLAMLYQAQMMDYESDFREKDFYKSIKMAKKYARERIKSNRKDAWAYLLLGNAYGAIALYEVRKGNWWSGLNNGLRAKSALKEAVKHDPELYDAYVSLGSYHYWASVVVPHWAGWLPFIGDRREEGISEIKLGYQRSIFSQDAAANGLIWIYINEKKFDQAISLAENMQNKYPEGKSFLWALATAYYEKSDWTNALLSYQEILVRIENQIVRSSSSDNHLENPNNYYNRIECKFHIANCLFNLGRFEECILTCEEIQNYPLDEKTKERQKDKLNRTKRLLEKSLKLLGKAAEG